MAQSSPQRNPASGPRAHRPSIPGGVRSLKGCLVRNDENQIILVSQRGSRVPVNSGEDLSIHLGQQVRASGAFVDKDQPADSDSKSKTEGSVHSERQFRVLKIEVLSQTCPKWKSR